MVKFLSYKNMLIKIKSKYLELSRDKKSVLVLVGGTAIAQAMNFLFSPIQTRLFSPEVFGELSLFTSITGILGVIVCLRYELAIVIPKEDEKGFALFKVSCIFALFISLISLTLLLIFKTKIFNIFNAKTLEKYWLFIPITLLLTGLIQASSYWLIRKRQFVVLTYSKVFTVFAVNVVSICLGFTGRLDVAARLLSTLIGSVVSLVVIFGEGFRKKLKIPKNCKYRLLELVKSFRNTLLFDVWGALLNNLSWMIIPILMNVYYSTNVAGQYSIGMRVIHIPASLIGESITQVFLKNASEERHNKTLYKFSKKLLKKVIISTLPIAILMLVFGKPVFRFVFGAKWELAGVYTQILAPWALIWFCASPMHIIFSITQKQSMYLIFSIINLITRFLSLYIGKLVNSDIIGIMLFSVFGFFAYGISIIYALNAAKLSDTEI